MLEVVQGEGEKKSNKRLLSSHLVFITLSLMEPKKQGLAHSLLPCHPHTFNGPLKVCYFIVRLRNRHDSCKFPVFFSRELPKTYHREGVFIKKETQVTANTNEDVSSKMWKYDGGGGGGACCKS